MLKDDPSLVFQRDAVGGNLIHVAYLYEQYHIAHWLVENFPRAGLLAYSEDIGKDGTAHPVASRLYLDDDDDAGKLDPTSEMIRQSSKRKGGETVTSYFIEIPPSMMPYTG